MSSQQIGCTRRLRRAGLTLVEMLVVMVMTVILAVAIGFAFNAEMRMQRSADDRRAQTDHTANMETQITRMLRGARLSTPTTDTTTYFQGVSDGGASELGSDRITFTTTAPGVPMTSIDSQDDFETQQDNVGPVGGLAEVSIGTNPVGDAGDKVGLFERLERPSDSDSTQGGNEFVLDPDVDTIGFQFWDGNEWVQSWDTTTGSRRLPEAVQISYTLKGSTDTTPRMFVVPITASDVTSQNPYASGGSS